VRGKIDTLSTKAANLDGNLVDLDTARAARGCSRAVRVFHIKSYFSMVILCGRGGR
jgi:hypothetical protein